MTSQDLLNFDEEIQSTNLITLVKDKQFWRAYDQSAFLFTNHFWPGLKVNGGYVKAAGRDMFYVGFPDASLQKIIDKIPEVGNAFLMEHTANQVLIANVPPVNGFEEWKQGQSQLREQANDQMQPYYGKLPLYKATYDCFFQVVNLTRQFPKDVQYTIGEQVIKTGLDINTQLYRLLKTDKLHPDDRLKIIDQIDEKIETLRFLLRISYDMKLYNVERFSDISASIESIRKQLHGWRKKHEVAS